jgi:uncharacterized protein YjiK
MPAILRSFCHRLLRFAIPILAILFLPDCSATSGKSFYPSLPHYDESHKEIFVLKKKLLEISGLNYQEDGRIAAMNDEDGKLFLFRLTDANDTIETIKFAGKGDYEDIATVDGTYYIMESNGDLHSVIPGNSVVTNQYKFDHEKKVEFESLVYYKNQNKLVMITKDHRLDSDAVYGFSFDLAKKEFDSEPFFIIPMNSILKKLKDYSAKFKPSAAAINPVLNKLFIIASVGKVLVQCSLDGKVEARYKLNPSQFPQPEGITFASNGDMYISNEGLEGKATILKFPYKP